jgi:hypothetical protein
VEEQLKYEKDPAKLAKMKADLRAKKVASELAQKKR